MLARSSSISLVEHIITNKAKLTVVDPYVKVPLGDADFDEIAPLGEGTQGFVYAVTIHLRDDPEEYRYVVKRMRKKRVCFPTGSFSASPSGATFVQSTTTFPGDALIEDGSFSSAARSAASVFSKRKKHRERAPSFDQHSKITKDDEGFTDHNIIKLIHIINHRGEDYALLPYCDLFLDSFMEDQLCNMNIEQRITLTCEVSRDILEAVSHLNYTKNYTHRDIKPENIARHNGKWQLVDFECAAAVGQNVKEVMGSPFYMHPWCFVDSSKSAFPGNDLYAVGQIMRQLLGLNSMYSSTSYYSLVDEKIKLHRAEIAAKWGGHKKPVYTSGTSQMERLTRLTEKICGLMSDQPDIDEIQEEINTLLDRDSSLSSGDSSLFSKMYMSSKSDGYFGSSHEKAEAHLMDAPKRLERRQSSWGGILVDSNSDEEDSVFDEEFGTFHEVNDHDEKSNIPSEVKFYDKLVTGED